MTRTSFLRLGLALLAAPLLAVGCEQTIGKPTPVPVPVPAPGPVACTMEAKQCPDGSYVGRVGPNCEFAACPSPTPAPVPTPGTEGTPCTGSGDTSCGYGYACTQECGPPVARDTDPPPGWSCYPVGKPRMCPICLASNTMIATLSGEVNVKDVKPGMRVWSVNARGEKIASTVLRISHTSVPKTHQVVHLVLIDGRNVWVSPGHPTIDGTPVGDLRPGNRYDGTVVASAELVPYWDGYTYDLLPDHSTGAYWANGILLGSTLTQP